MSETDPSAVLVLRTTGSEAGPAAFRASAFLFVVAVVLVAGHVFWFGWPNLREIDADFNPVALFFAFVAAMLGTFFLARAVIHTRRFRVAGESELRANEPRLGETFAGTIRSERAITPRGDFTVRLRCDNVRSVRNMKGDGRNTQTETLWEGAVTVPVASRTDAGVPFAIAVPADGLPTGSRGEAGRIEWALEIRAPMGGIDHMAEFPIRMQGRRKPAAGDAPKAAKPRGASRQEPFAGQVKPVSKWLRIALPVSLVLGALLAVAGLYRTAQEVMRGHNGAQAAGRVVAAEKSVVQVAIDGSGPPPVTARVAIGSNFHRWEPGQPVRIVCRELGAEPRGCRMDTGAERWIDTLGTLLVGMVLLAAAGWIWRRVVKSPA